MTPRFLPPRPRPTWGQALVFALVFALAMNLFNHTDDFLKGYRQGMDDARGHSGFRFPSQRPAAPTPSPLPQPPQPDAPK